MPNKKILVKVGKLGKTGQAFEFARSRDTRGTPSSFAARDVQDFTEEALSYKNAWVPSVLASRYRQGKVPRGLENVAWASHILSTQYTHPGSEEWQKAMRVLQTSDDQRNFDILMQATTEPERRYHLRHVQHDSEPFKPYFLGIAAPYTRQQRTGPAGGYRSGMARDMKKYVTDRVDRDAYAYQSLREPGGYGRSWSEHAREGDWGSAFTELFKSYILPQMPHGQMFADLLDPISEEVVAAEQPEKVQRPDRQDSIK